MPTATVTSKGQITIPIKVRKALGLKPGVRIDFYETENGEYVLRAKTGSIKELEGCLAHLGSAVELDRATMSEAVQSKNDGEAA